MSGHLLPARDSGTRPSHMRPLGVFFYARQAERSAASRCYTASIHTSVFHKPEVIMYLWCEGGGGMYEATCGIAISLARPHTNAASSHCMHHLAKLFNWMPQSGGWDAVRRLEVRSSGSQRHLGYGKIGLCEKWNQWNGEDSMGQQQGQEEWVGSSFSTNAFRQLHRRNLCIRIYYLNNLRHHQLLPTLRVVLYPFANSSFPKQSPAQGWLLLLNLLVNDWVSIVPTLALSSEHGRGERLGGGGGGGGVTRPSPSICLDL